MTLKDYHPDGSKTRRAESDAEKVLQAARRKFEAAGGPTINVKLPRRLASSEIDGFVSQLQALNMEALAVGESLEMVHISGRKIHLTRSFHPDWLIVSDRVGWVLQDGSSVVQAAIDRKAHLVPAYREACGNDVRLLVVADSDFNSGKVRIAAETLFDGQGFAAVYFLSDPVQALELRLK